MLKKKTENPTPELWIASDMIVTAAPTTFYHKLQSALDAMGFGEKVRAFCEPHYSPKSNVRPPIDPEVYFKMLLVGFFENIRSERGIAHRCGDSLSIRSFLRYDLTQQVPDHSTLSVIRQRLPKELYIGVFRLVLDALRTHGLVRGKHLAIDSSVMEANAALRSLTNKMTEQSYDAYIKALAKEAGIDPNDRAAVANFDRKRKGRKTSNKEWHNPHDTDAKIGKTKHGATDMLYKPEHTVDLETGAIVNATVLLGDQGDAEGLTERIDVAREQLESIGLADVESVTSDKGYCKAKELALLQARGLRTIIPDGQPKRNRANYTQTEWAAVKKAEAEVKSDEGKRFLRLRGQQVERSFAHALDSGGARRTTLRGIENIEKRYIVTAMAYNLSLMMRAMTGFGTPKQQAAVERWLHTIIRGICAITKWMRCIVVSNRRATKLIKLATR
jgi:transposase